MTHNLGQRFAPKEVRVHGGHVADTGHIYPTTDWACEKEQAAPGILRLEMLARSHI